MPLFRRRPQQAEELRVSVGVDGHELVVGGRDAGLSMLDELDGYVGVIARRMPSSADGRDSIAVQNAKMDYVEMTDAAMLVVTLALEELQERAVITTGDLPAKPHFAPIDGDLATYEYIQETYRRAEARVVWMRGIDTLLRERGVGVVKPQGG